jgi:transposase-like protein
MPVVGPRTLPEFQRTFATEAACAAFLMDLRWPEGFVCLACGGGASLVYESRRVVVCRKCRKHWYLTAGTVMHRSKLPLQTWFYGAFVVATLTPGISAVQFQKQLGLSRYETAFQMLHKLRAALVAPEREPLTGVVEVDETFVGGIHRGGARGRSQARKTMVVGAVEVVQGPHRTRAGRIRLEALPEATSEALLEFLRHHVIPGTRVHTDGFRGYSGRLDEAGYVHRPEPGAELLHIHRTFANLKTWLRGTHHDRVERQHLQAYLNEFSFRHNRRFWRSASFIRVLQIATAVRAPTYREIYGADAYGANVHQR